MKIKKKNAILEAEMVEFGQKIMILLLSPCCWPNSNLKAANFARICIPMQNKTSTETKISKKMPFRRPR